MPERELHEEWRNQNRATPYPFAQHALLTNGNRHIPYGVFLDAALHPAGGREGSYLARVQVNSDGVVFTVGDAGSKARCSGPATAEGLIALADSAGRAAGILVADADRLAVFRSWGLGAHDFLRPQTEFATTVCWPCPASGVRGLRLPDGTVVSGEVWLVGGDGVVVSSRQLEERLAGVTETITAIRVDVVGDPLVRRRLCAQSPEDFVAPRFIRALRIDGSGESFYLRPDVYGNIQIFASDALQDEAVLRVLTTDQGIEIGVLGSRIDEGP